SQRRRREKRREEHGERGREEERGEREGEEEREREGEDLVKEGRGISWLLAGHHGHRISWTNQMRELLCDITAELRLLIERSQRLPLCRHTHTHSLTSLRT